MIEYHLAPILKTLLLDPPYKRLSIMCIQKKTLTIPHNIKYVKTLGNTINTKKLLYA